jgi:carbonic anhydrase
MHRIVSKCLVVVSATVFAGVAGLCAAAGDKTWSYAGPNGPAKWSTLEKGFAICKTGDTQSPIDIPDAKVRKGDLPALLFNYRPSPLKIIDNGHTIQVDYAPGSYVSVNGKIYNLVQFHFHKPSEEKVNGKAHEMVVHLVHQTKDGKLGVIAVFLDPGKENPLIKTLWSNLPQTKDNENVVANVNINALELLPQNKGYYTYSGSLTTPPCTEDVTWFVLMNPVQVSADQIARFGRLYPMNARPVQPINDRDIMGTVR